MKRNKGRYFPPYSVVFQVYSSKRSASLCVIVSELRVARWLNPTFLFPHHDSFLLWCRRNDRKIWRTLLWFSNCDQVKRQEEGKKKGLMTHKTKGNKEWIEWGPFVAVGRPFILGSWYALCAVSLCFTIHGAFSMPGNNVGWLKRPQRRLTEISIYKMNMSLWAAKKREKYSTINKVKCEKKTVVQLLCTITRERLWYWLVFYQRKNMSALYNKNTFIFTCMLIETEQKKELSKCCLFKGAIFTISGIINISIYFFHYLPHF